MCVSNRLSPDFVPQFLKFDKDGMAAALKRISPFARGASKGSGPLTLPDGAVLESGESCRFLHPEKRDWVKGVFEGPKITSMVELDIKIKYL